MAKAMMIIAALVLAANLVRHREQLATWLDAPSPAATSAHRVVLYATRWCGYCAKTRAFFRENGIAYEERDIEQSATAAAEYRELGKRGVPVIVVDDTVVIPGYDPEWLREVLGR